MTYPSDEDLEREQSSRSFGGAKGRKKSTADIFRDAVSTYGYLDEDGVLLYQVARDSEKNFAQRRPNVGRDPQEPAWIYETKAVRRVLYRLPEVKVAIAQGHRVYVVEGEKDADNLAKLGLTTTTAAMGAKAPWLPGYTDQLSGCSDVVIIPDNDKPGAQHAEAVASALAGKVPSLRVLALPVTNEGADVSDWIATGGTRVQLEALVDAARPYSGPGNRYIDVEVGGYDFLNRQIEPPESLVGDGIMTRSALGFLVAAAGRGKSQLIVQLAVARALGVDWLGLKVKQGRTALLLLELSAYWWQQRIRIAAGDRAEEALNAIRIVCRPDLRGLVDIADPAELDALGCWVKKTESDLLSIDPLSRAHALDENAFTVMGPLLQRIELFGFEYDVGTLINHHERKSHSGSRDGDLDVASGSRVISGNATCYMRLVETKHGGPMYLRFAKTSTSGHVPDIWLRREPSGLLVPTDPPEKVGNQNRDRVLQALVEGVARGGVTNEEIQKVVGLKHGAVSGHLSAVGAVQIPASKPPKYLPPSTTSTGRGVEDGNLLGGKNLDAGSIQLPFSTSSHLPSSMPSALKGGKADGSWDGFGSRGGTEVP